MRRPTRHSLIRHDEANRRPRGSRETVRSLGWRPRTDPARKALPLSHQTRIGFHTSSHHCTIASR